MLDEIDPDLEMILAELSGEFIEETNDKILEIEHLVENIKSQSGSSANYFLEIKRLMHTIKGGGGSFGFPTISKIAHGFEDYLETSSQMGPVVADDLLVFTDAISSILDSGVDPDDQHAFMMLRSLPSGRRQSGRQTMDKGVILLLMPKGVQRKIISQELAQFGFKVRILEDPIEGLDVILTLRPDFLIVNFHMKRISGVEMAGVLNSIASTQDIRTAIITSDDISEDILSSVPPQVTFVHKGPTFSHEMMNFIRT